MDDFNNIINQLKDSSGKLKQNLHLLEEIIPVEEQMKYFEYSKHIRLEHDFVNRNILIADLFSSESDLEKKRYSLSMLAGLVDIAAYRAIEAYHKNPVDEELANWSALALTESQLLLDSDLSGEEQFLVSTGLGGVNGMLRFFSIVASKERIEFNELQKQIINREFNFRFDCDNIIAEEFSIEKNYIKILLLADLKHDIKESFEKIIYECNELGDFLDVKFMLTNVRQFNDEEIEKLLDKKIER